MEKRKKFGLWRGAGLLTAAAILAKALGAMYKIPLVRALGAVGMGMYQAIFPTYALLVTLASGGWTAAVSKAAAEDETFDTGRAVRLCLIAAAALTAAGVAAAYPVARALGTAGAAFALAVMIISLPCSAASAVWRGYLLGRGDLRVSAWGQLLEQAIKFAVGLSLAFALAPLSMRAALAGCAVGITASEISTTLFYARYGARARKSVPCDPSADAAYRAVETMTEASEELCPALPTPQKEREKTFAAKMYKVVFPVLCGGLILPLCGLLDSFVVVPLLTRAGADTAAATSIYGLVSGPIAALVRMPAVLTVGLCAALLPHISRMRKRGLPCGKLVARVSAAAICGGLIFGGGLAIAAPLVLRIVYGKAWTAVPGAALLLRLSGGIVPLLAFIQVASSVLQGGDEAHLPALTLLCGGLAKAGCLFLLVPRLGGMGYVLSDLALYVVAAAMDGVLLIRFCMRSTRASSANAEKRELCGKENGICHEKT